MDKLLGRIRVFEHILKSGFDQSQRRMLKEHDRHSGSFVPGENALAGSYSRSKTVDGILRDSHPLLGYAGVKEIPK